jgi:hypothetical protein
MIIYHQELGGIDRVEAPVPGLFNLLSPVLLRHHPHLNQSGYKWRTAISNSSGYAYLGVILIEHDNRPNYTCSYINQAHQRAVYSNQGFK